MNANAILKHTPDDEVIAWLEEEGLVPMRPIRERWPDLFAAPPPSVPIECPERLPGDGGPIVAVPERWYPGVPLPATYEREVVAGCVEPDTAHAAAHDWLAGRLSKSAVPAGRYPIESQPDCIDIYTTPRTSGVAFTVTIVEGPWQGGEIHLRFVLDGPLDGVVRHNLDLLARWAQAVDAGPATDPIDLVARLGRAGSGRRVILDIRERQNGDRRDIYVAAVEVTS